MKWIEKVGIIIMISDNIKDLITLILEKKFELDTTTQGGSPNVDLKTRFHRLIHGSKALVKNADTHIKPRDLVKATIHDTIKIGSSPLSAFDAIKNTIISRNKTDFVKKMGKDTIMNIPGAHLTKLGIDTAKSAVKRDYNINRLHIVNKAKPKLLQKIMTK